MALRSCQRSVTRWGYSHNDVDGGGKAQDSGGEEQGNDKAVKWPHASRPDLGAGQDLWW